MIVRIIITREPEEQIFLGNLTVETIPLPGDKLNFEVDDERSYELELVRTRNVPVNPGKLFESNELFVTCKVLAERAGL